MTGTDRLDWTLQQYSIGHLIASGHFGVVYHARHRPTGRDVALKLIPLQGQDSEEKVAAERHGALLQQRFGLAHPGLVPAVFEHETIVPFYAIAMELVHGQQLSQLIAQGALDSRHAAGIGLAIATFLDAAHRFVTEIEGQQYALIVHADLKPDHVLRLDDGTIRVLDFGIAKALATRTLVTTNRWGSIQYASPERLQSDGHVNEHADFWSLGVMLFEMVAGYRPYRRHEHNPGALDQAIRTQHAREPLPPNVEPALAAIIHKLLASQIERRYDRAEAIARDLEAFLRGAPTTAGLEQARAGQETIRLPGAEPPVGRRQAPVPTEPLPARAQTQVSAPPPPLPRPAAPGGIALRTPMRTRLARLAFMALVIAMVATEALALLRAERLRVQIPTLEMADLPRVRDEFDKIDLWMPVGLGSGHVAGRLSQRMVQLADGAILEFRMEVPALAQADWQRARDCLDLALRLRPGDERIQSRWAYVRGQLARIAGRDREAIRLFREAARLDPESPDPYLGLASLHAYVTRDMEGLSEAIREAERRGYTRTRRELVELGDLHKFLADRTRTNAAALEGPRRIEQLERAAADYRKCIQYFEGLRVFDSEEHLRDCRRRLSDIVPQLPERAPTPAPLGVRTAYEI